MVLKTACFLIVTVSLDRPVFLIRSARFPMAKKSIPDYYFAIDTDKMTQQKEETGANCLVA